MSGILNPTSLVIEPFIIEIFVSFFRSKAGRLQILILISNYRQPYHLGTRFFANLLILSASYPINATATSLTFVPVGPVMISPPTFPSAWYASLSARTAWTSIP